MPMVGTATDSVMRTANGSTTPSTTMANAPASATSAASWMWRAQLSASRPWVLKPPSVCVACGSRPTWPITGMPRSVRKRIVGAMRLPPSSLR